MVELGFPEAIFELNYRKYNKLATLSLDEMYLAILR
jgi:hypothetical protein